MFRKSRSKLLATITAIVVLMALTSQAVTALQADNQPEVLFKIPLGEQGVNYEGVGIPESLVSGPKALTVAPDGSFWIVDTASNRLLHFDGKGNLLQAVQLKDWVVGVGT